MKSELTKIRRWYGAPVKSVLGLFDTGSEEGLILSSAAGALTRTRLPSAIAVVGIGGASTEAVESTLFLVQVLGKWCRTSALVVPDPSLDVDLLLGEDFLMRYGLSIDVRRNRVEIAYPEHFRRMTRRKIFVATPRPRAGWTTNTSSHQANGFAW